MSKFTQEEIKRLSVLELLKQTSGCNTEQIDKEIQLIYHEAERREDIELQHVANEESKKANKLTNKVIWINIITFLVSTGSSILISLLLK